MKIQILSDIHIEFGDFEHIKTDANLIVLAGDVHTKDNGLRWIKQSLPYVPILYIMGNHEFYGEHFPSLIDQLKTEAQKEGNIHILENEVFEMNGYRFFGSTLWADYALHGNPEEGAKEALNMNDYKKIYQSDSYENIEPADTRERHLESIAAIKTFMASGDPERSIIITHHAPSPQSIPKLVRKEPIYCAYASNLEALIEETQPRLWIHGHLHDSRDYNIGKSRIIANPRGYVNKAYNPAFEPDLVVDLST